MDAVFHLTIHIVGSDRAVRVQVAEGQIYEVSQSQSPRELRMDLPVTQFLPVRVWEERRLLWDGTVFLDGQTDVILTFRMENEGTDRVAKRIGTIADVQSMVVAPPEWVGAVWGGMILAFFMVIAIFYRRVQP
jgi:hypothetical protein